MTVGSLASASQLGASGFPQRTFFHTTDPSAAFRQYIVLPPPKYTRPSATAALLTTIPPIVSTLPGAGVPGGRHCGGTGTTVVWQSSWNFHFTAPVAPSNA